MKYNRIVKCDLSSNNYNEIFKNCYLLTYKGCDSCMEIDLTSDFWFNIEFLATKKIEIAIINNITELIDFLKKHNLDTKKFYDEILKDNKLFVGGCNDYVLDYELKVLGWKDEV